MEATWDMLSGCPADTVVWRCLRICDVLSLLCVNKSIRKSTLRAFAVMPLPKTTIFKMMCGDEPQCIYNIGVHMIMHGHADVCVVRTTVHTNDRPIRAFPCKWHASANPRYGKFLITHVRRLLRDGQSKRILVSFTSAIEEHHFILAQQMQRVEQKFVAVTCSLIVASFTDTFHLNRIGQLLVEGQHLSHKNRLVERRQIANLLLGPKICLSDCTYCTLCTAIMFGPAHVYYAFRYLCSPSETKLAHAVEFEKEFQRQKHLWHRYRKYRQTCLNCGGPASSKLCFQFVKAVEKEARVGRQFGQVGTL